jgi:eukaryotic-like serine/threonine-protein kinase
MPEISPGSERLEARPPAGNGIPPEKIDAALRKILNSPEFVQAIRSSRFLEFVVSKTLSGQGGTIKEYLIGTEAFDRPAGYDPRNDPIVRVEAGRLRSRLADYYRGTGSQDLIQIDLPKGSYAPTFTRRDNGAAKPGSVESVTPTAPNSASVRLSAWQTKSRWKWAITIVVLAATAAVTFYYWKQHVRLYSAGTTSAVALGFYNDGLDVQNTRGDADSITYFNRAIELDPKFALAYAALGMVYRDMGEQEKADANLTKAFQLRSDRAGAEDFRISAFYYSIVTGELQKANEYYQVWSERYPHDAVPRSNWAMNCNALGEYDKAVKETVEALQIGPPGAPAYGNLVGYYTSLKQLAKARETYAQGLAQKLDGAALRGNRYGVAFLDKDQATMDSLMKWAADQPGVNDLFLSLQSDTETFYGRLHKAREYSNRAVQAAERDGQKESAALHLLDAALREVELGNPELAKSESTQALAWAPTPNVQILAAVILARAGDTLTAAKLADRLQEQHRLNTVLNGYWLPTIRGAIDLSSNHPAEALQTLEGALPYELGQPDPSVGVGGLLYPAYIRGQAYLQLGKGAPAATEFQKLVDQWGVMQNSLLGALAHLGVARAYALLGDTAKAKVAYQNFFAIWREADVDIPILVQAKSEYAKLQ